MCVLSSSHQPILIDFKGFLFKKGVKGHISGTRVNYQCPFPPPAQFHSCLYEGFFVCLCVLTGTLYSSVRALLYRGRAYVF